MKNNFPTCLLPFGLQIKFKNLNRLWSATKAMVVSAREASKIGVEIMKSGNDFTMVATELALVAYPYAGNLGSGGL
jgi:gamma-glutamyltranspeptidase